MENPLPVDAGVEAPTGGVTARDAGVEAPTGRVIARDAGVEAPTGGVTARDAGVEAPTGEVTVRDAVFEASAGGVTVKGVGVFGTYEHDGVSEDMLRLVSGTPDEDEVANTVVSNPLLLSREL